MNLNRCCRIYRTGEKSGPAGFISLSIPLRTDTKNIISAPEPEFMKPGVRIINFARDGLLSEDALFDALQCDKVAGTALDVFDQDPTRRNGLLKRDNVLPTPHLGALTKKPKIVVTRDINRTDGVSIITIQQVNEKLLIDD